MSVFRCVGLMSGSSMDAADVCLADFTQTPSGWKFNIVKAKDFPYPDNWRLKLQTAHLLPAGDLLSLDADLAKLFAAILKDLVNSSSGQPVFVAGIHGHTVFHFPEKTVSYQAGSGGVIAPLCGIDCVSDFRIQDIALGGQGAPLVPMGEKELFPQYGGFLNLGGIANISLMEAEVPVAFDSCPCNRVLDYLAETVGKSYDEDGRLASAGSCNQPLLDLLLNKDYFHQPWPKSLGNQWARENIIPVLEASPLSVEDKMATAAEWISSVIAADLNRLKEKHTGWNKPLLVSGGGANNSFLWHKIEAKFKGDLIIAEPRIRQYKEALIFGFLALLRKLEIPNVLHTSTGSVRASVSGALYSHC